MAPPFQPLPDQQFLEPEAGIEPATPRLRIVCSAKLSYSGEVNRL